MNTLEDSFITVVGLGLMGGSLAAGLKGKCRKVVGVDRDAVTVKRAIELGFIDTGTCDLVQGVLGADIVILATPVRTIITLMEQLADALEEGTLLMDIGSTKSGIVQAMDKLPMGIEVLGGHPMCGKEISGIEAAEPDLYEGRTFILSPLERTSETALAMGKAIAEAVGANPLVVAAERQDYLVGTLSHLPYLLACAMVSTADQTTSSDPLAWRIHAGSYRDTTRVAGSDINMMLDILSTNREQVLKAVEVYQQQLGRLAALVDAGDEAQLRELLSYLRDTRKEMYR